MQEMTTKSIACKHHSEGRAVGKALGWRDDVVCDLNSVGVGRGRDG
jgi:hypothetical protein